MDTHTGLSEDLSDSTQNPDSDTEQRLYFVSYRWWRDAQDSVLGDSEGKRGIVYAASSASAYAAPMEIINNIFNSDLAFNLRREEDCVGNTENGEVSVSGRDFALVSGEMWVEALKWHSDSKVSMKEGRGFSAADDDMADVYPLQLRLSVLRETNSLGVRISKKDNAVGFYKRACKIFGVELELLCIWDFSGQMNLFLLNDKHKFSRDCQWQSDEVFKSLLFAKRPQDSVSFYKCLEAFLKEEPLGPEDVVGLYCPGCKEHRQASKKLDLWILPGVLVIHLKRFSYGRLLKNKLETFVGFPVDNLDLSTYIGHKDGQLSNRYMLYAVSNHYGSMGGGHYTAFVHHCGDWWYDFDDSNVNPIILERR